MKRALSQAEKQPLVRAGKKRAVSKPADSSSVSPLTPDPSPLTPRASRLTPSGRRPVSSEVGHPTLAFATPAVQEKLARIGIRQLSDLVTHLPMRYEDETRIVSIHEALSGDTVQVEGTVVETQIKFRPGRQLISEIDDGSGRLVMRFFNFYPSQKNALAPGAKVRVMGEIRQGFFGAEMVHPRFRVVRAAACMKAP